MSLVDTLRTERRRLLQHVAAIDSHLRLIAGPITKKAKKAIKSAKRTMSAATKEKIRKAAKARWAKIKKA
jgi:hypothetical protein